MSSSIVSGEKKKKIKFNAETHYFMHFLLFVHDRILSRISRLTVTYNRNRFDFSVRCNRCKNLRFSRSLIAPRK